MTDCFSNSDSDCAMMRETISVPPPAPKPTITWIGRSAGHSAMAGAAAAVMTAAAMAASDECAFHEFLPFLVTGALRAPFRPFSSSIGLLSTPMPSTSISMVSPGFIQTGSGLRA